MCRWKVAMVGLGVLAASVLLALAARGSGVDRPAANRPAAPNAPGELPPGHPQEMGIPHSRRGPDIELTDSQVAELLEALKSRWPTAHARLMRVKQERSRTYQRALQLYWQMYRRWKDAPKDVQEAYVALPEMRVQVGDLLRDF
ncbi:MAG TPA: hypothetical protein VM098_08510, partial [Phycisphaerae bacterium]|nr:hypothetical protein [Phycisphaerae bacterium]